MKKNISAPKAKVLTPKIQRDLVETLANNELAVGSLYKIYSEKFPEYKAFWTHLVTDEGNHCTWLRDLLKEVDRGSLFIDKDRFNAMAITSFTEYVKGLTEAATKEDTKLVVALSHAKDIEGSLIERGFFTIYETDSPTLKLVLNDLKRVTEIHEKMAVDAWEKEAGIPQPPR